MSDAEPTDGKEDYRVPVDAHGAVIVRASDEDEAFEIAREKARPSASNLSMSVGESYRERVRSVEEDEYPNRDPINVQNDEGAETVRIPQFPSVDHLRGARKALGLTQAEVAEAMGVSPKTVSHYEQGTREISLQRAREYAAVLRREQ